MWRSTSVPMKTPRSRLRSTAYHMVVASPVPWIGCQGRGGAVDRVGDAGLHQLAQGGDLTRVGVDEERGHRGRTVAARAAGRLARRARACSTRTCAAAARPRARARVYGTRRRASSARWAGAYDARRRPTIDYPWLRRYAAQLAERGPRAAHRRRASSPRCARCFRVLVEHGVMEANPADLLASPKLPQRLPRALKPADVVRAARPDPGLDAARAARSRAVRARLRVRPARRGARQPRRRLGRLRRRAGARRGQGRQDPLRARSGEHALAALTPLSGARARHARRRHGRARAVPLQDRPAALDVGRPAPPADVGAARRGPGRGPSARPAALVRDPSAGGRRRSARDPGAARPRRPYRRPRSTLG